MTVARLLPLVLLLGSGPVLAETISAETALKRYRERFATIDQIDCPRDGDIVVCGRRIGTGLRVPYVRAEGEPVHLLPGEPPRASSNLSISQCVRSCPQPLRVDLIGAVATAGKVIGHLLGHDD